MTLERKKNSMPRRQADRRTNNNNNNNSSTATSATCSSTLSTGLSACASSPAAGLPCEPATINNNVSYSDSVKTGKCLSSVGKCDDEVVVDEPLNSRNTPSAINILTSSTGSTADQFANR